MSSNENLSRSVQLGRAPSALPLNRLNTNVVITVNFITGNNPVYGEFNYGTVSARVRPLIFRRGKVEIVNGTVVQLYKRYELLTCFGTSITSPDTKRKTNAANFYLIRRVLTYVPFD